MKKYTLSFAASTEHVPEHPERTAFKTFGWDEVFQVWPSAAAMKKTIEMQGRRALRPDDWKPWLASGLGRRFLARKLPSTVQVGRFVGLEGSGPGGSHEHSIHCIESGPNGLYCKVTGEGS